MTMKSKVLALSLLSLPALASQPLTSEQAFTADIRAYQAVIQQFENDVREDAAGAAYAGDLRSVSIGVDAEGNQRHQVRYKFRKGNAESKCLVANYSLLHEGPIPQLATGAKRESLVTCEEADRAGDLEADEPSH